MSNETKTCSNCKYWGRDRVGVCDRVDDNRVPKNLQFEIVVKVSDDYGLYTYLITGPDFGCVLFEKGKGDHDEFADDEDD